MVGAIVAIDMGEVESLMESDSLIKWFNERKFNVDDDSISNENEIIGFSHYVRAGVVIFRFDNAEDYFPNIIEDFIGALEDSKNTTISVAEDGRMGYETIIEMNLANFTKHILSEEDEDTNVEAV